MMANGTTETRNIVYNLLLRYLSELFDYKIPNTLTKQQKFLVSFSSFSCWTAVYAEEKNSCKNEIFLSSDEIIYFC